MKVGVIFPQTEIGNDPSAIKDYAQVVEGLGYSHILAYDHVLGADTTRSYRAGKVFFYNHESAFHEVFVLLGYLAGITDRLELVTGVLILPQRQTALVAKQAAAIDVLSGGRLRLGVGSGWNSVEYEALGQDFHTRGRRLSEQVDVLRALWGKLVVDLALEWHRVDGAGLNPLPTRRIPIWMGGEAEAVLRRMARQADGWFPQFRPDDADGWAAVDRLHGYLREAGRDPADFGLEARQHLAGSPESWARELSEWRKGGVSHLSLNTMDLDLNGPSEHIKRLSTYALEVGLT